MCVHVHRGYGAFSLRAKRKDGRDLGLGVGEETETKDNSCKKGVALETQWQAGSQERKCHHGILRRRVEPMGVRKPVNYAELQAFLFGPVTNSWAHLKASAKLVVIWGSTTLGWGSK